MLLEGSPPNGEILSRHKAYPAFAFHRIPWTYPWLARGHCETGLSQTIRPTRGYPSRGHCGSVHFTNANEPIPSTFCHRYGEDCLTTIDVHPGATELVYTQWMFECIKESNER